MEIQRIKVGMRVKWNDPGIDDYDPEDREEVLNRVFVVDEVEDNDDPLNTFVHITEEGGFSEAEVFECELIAI